MWYFMRSSYNVEMRMSISLIQDKWGSTPARRDAVPAAALACHHSAKNQADGPAIAVRGVSESERNEGAARQLCGCTGNLDADEVAIDQFGTMPDHSGEFAQIRRNRHRDTEREVAVHH